MSVAFRSSFVVAVMMVAAVACSSSSSGTDSSDAGSSGGGGGDGGGGGGGDGGGGGKGDGGGGGDSGGSGGCTATFTSSENPSDTFTMSCNNGGATETSNITTFGINGTDGAGHTLECEYEFNGDPTVKTYMNADSIAMTTSLTASGGTVGWQQASTESGDSRGMFGGLTISAVGPEHDLGSSKQYQAPHGSVTGTAVLFTGDAGTDTYAFTINF